MCIVRDAQSTQNDKFTISLQYLKEKVKHEVDFLPADKYQKSLQIDHFRCVWPGMPKLPKITILLFLCNIFRIKWVMMLVFCMQISIKTCYKLIPWFWWRWSSIPKIASLQCIYNISKKKLEMKLIFCMQINIGFLQVDSNTFGIKVSYRMILSLLMGMIKHSYFNCNLAAPLPTSGHYQGDSLTHLMLITAFGSLITSLGP